jgi:hypothetical protein
MLGVFSYARSRYMSTLEALVGVLKLWLVHTHCYSKVTFPFFCMGSLLFKSDPSVHGLWMTSITKSIV